MMDELLRLLLFVTHIDRKCPARPSTLQKRRGLMSCGTSSGHSHPTGIWHPAPSLSRKEKRVLSVAHAIRSRYDGRRMIVAADAPINPQHPYCGGAILRDDLRLADHPPALESLDVALASFEFSAGGAARDVCIRIDSPNIGVRLVKIISSNKIKPTLTRFLSAKREIL